MARPMSEISTFLEKRYGHLGDEGRSVCNVLEWLWDAHRPLADDHFVREFCSGGEGKFVQRYWEMRLGQLLRDAGWALYSKKEGPDFLAIRGSTKVWIEAIAPDVGTGKNKLPEDY